MGINLTTQEKMQIAKDYIAKHKNADLTDWMEANSYQVPSDEEILLNVYEKLSQGVFGTVHEIDYEYEIEIGSHESKTGHAVLFSWDREKKDLYCKKCGYHTDGSDIEPESNHEFVEHTKYNPEIPDYDTEKDCDN